MRLLICGLNYSPELVGVAKYTTEMAEWLASRGHDVTVITTVPHYPEWTAGEGYEAFRYFREQRGGVTVQRCPMWLPKSYSPFKRVLSVISFAVCSFIPLLRSAWKRPDWLVVIEPTFFNLPGAWLASRIARIRLWLHVQDFELSAARGLGLVKGRWALGIAESIESWFLRRPHRVSTLSLPMLAHLAVAKVPDHRQVLFPNWVDCEQIRPLDRASSFRAELGIVPDRIVLLYSGSFGRKHGLELLTGAARHLREHGHLQFVLCGGGAEKKKLREQARDLKNVIWLPLQPKERLNDLLNLADIHLLPQRSTVASAVLPSKLSGMFASGRPVIATASAGTRLAEIVHHAGIVVPPGDEAGFSEAIVALGSDAARRRELGIEARRFAEIHYGKTSILEQFENQLANPGRL